MTLPAAQIDGGDPVQERGVKQAGGGIEKPGDSEELGADHSIGLTRGQHQIHESIGNAHRWCPSAFYFRECQVRSGPGLPGHTDRSGRGAKVPPGQVGNASTQAVPQCHRV